LFGTISNERKVKEQIKYDSLRSEYKEKVLKVNKYLFVRDTLMDIDDELRKRVIGEAENQLFGFNISGYNKNCLIPSEFFQYAVNGINLIPTSIFDERKIKMLGLDDDVYYIGYVTFSHILFNNDNTMGFLIYHYYCGNTCGEEVLLIVNKKEDKWKIVERIVMRVA